MSNRVKFDKRFLALSFALEPHLPLRIVCPLRVNNSTSLQVVCSAGSRRLQNSFNSKYTLAIFPYSETKAQLFNTIYMLSFDYQPTGRYIQARKNQFASKKSHTNSSFLQEIVQVTVNVFQFLVFVNWTFLKSEFLYNNIQNWF